MTGFARHPLWTWIGLAGALALGYGFGVLHDWRPVPALAMEVQDGLSVFGVQKPEGDMALDWGDLRVTPAHRSFAQVLGDVKDRPQMLVFPREHAWPALAVPRTWKVAWLNQRGEVLDHQVSNGQPLAARHLDRTRTTRYIFAVAPTSPCFPPLQTGTRVAWSTGTPGT